MDVVFESTKPWPMALQARYLKLAQPDSKIIHLCNSRLIWIGRVMSHPLGLTYVIKVRYQLLSFPQVWVLDPPLEKRQGENIPHMYAQERLCLFHPSKNEWSARKLLTHTILPWTALWLYHYEMWHATGEWHGGGEHPVIEPSIDSPQPDSDRPSGGPIHQPKNRSRAALRFRP
jgi:hypothetical protein